MAETHITLGHHGQPHTLSGAPELETEAGKALHANYDVQSNFAGLLMDTAMIHPEQFASMIKQMHQDHQGNPSIPDAQMHFENSTLTAIDFNGGGKDLYVRVWMPDEQNNAIKKASDS